MNLFELSAKISVDDSSFKRSMENAQKVSKNVANAIKELQSPLDKAKSGFNAIAHPVETAKANIEKLKSATEAIRHPIEAFKNKVADASTALETKRNKLSTLAAGYDSAKKKVADITKEFNKSAKESGTTSQKTQELAKKLSEAEKEAEEAKRELDDYSASVSKAGKSSDSASKGVGNFASKLGKGLATAGKAAGAALGVAAAGVTALTTQAVNNFAEYEQLVGGVDTLFKNASQKVQRYASEAYRTAGMSANDYMANATAFSASLISALGGDTEKAAEYANRAMISMSDNANKMGTDIDSIVQTYQSLARGNFAMLDNLKLGYGGTKEELERLIKDAASYTDIQKKMGITVDASSKSFDNIVNAIAVVQGKLGIAGATALEAGTTIEGSVNSMKAAWDNLVTGVADKNADLEGLINSFVTTIVGDGTESNLGVLGNIMPAVKQALNGASRLVSEAIPIIIKELPPIITENLPILATAAISIVQALVEGISKNQEVLIDSAFEVITTLAQGLLELLPDIIQLGLELLVSLANGIAQNLPTLIPTIIDVVLQIVDILTNQDTLNQLLSAALIIITELAFGLLENIDKLINAVILLLDGMIDFLIRPENLTLLISAALQLVIAIGEGIIKAIPQLLVSVTKMYIGIVGTFKSFDWASLGINLVNGFANGISKAWGNLKEWFKSLFGDLVGIAKKILGIASPSKVFRRFGIFVDEGLQGGLEFGAKDVFKTVANLASGVTASFNPDLTADYTVRYNNNTANQSRFGALNAYNNGTNKTEVVVSIDDSISPLSFARYLLPYLKVAQKEAFA